MRTHAQGSLATFLLLIPILTVPMLAIFGVPQFTPVVASPYEQRRPSKSASESEAPPFAVSEDAASAAFLDASRSLPTDLPAWAEAPLDRTARALADRRNSSSTPSAGPPNRSPAVRATDETHPSPFQLETAAISGTASGSYRRPRPAANADRHSTTPSPSPESSPAVALTWQAAVRRLNELEIRNFRLEPGQQPQQFVFHCSYTPHDNPRVSYRFEAEADEPLRAVEKVLEQIDAWLVAR